MGEFKLLNKRHVISISTLTTELLVHKIFQEFALDSSMTSIYPLIVKSNCLEAMNLGNKSGECNMMDFFLLEE